ncbi:MAG: monovalent cation/H(+) antiporter subunit G [Chloroflexota bacterium]
MGTLIQEIAALVFFAFGLFFILVGVVGVIRLPDAFSRLHASGKVATLGLLGIIIAVGIMVPSAILKLIVLALMVAIAAPVNSHAIAKADKEYTLRAERARDTSISADGDQPGVKATTETEIVSANEGA